MIFGRAWIIKQILDHFASPQQATKLATLMNAKIDIPGVPEEIEQRMAEAITTNSIRAIRSYLTTGKGDFDFSKRYVLIKILTGLRDNIPAFNEAVDIPLLSEVSEEKAAEFISSIITQELIPYVEAHF